MSRSRYKNCTYPRYWPQRRTL